MCVPPAPPPYVEGAPPPGTQMEPVPHWMVREVLEQRHRRSASTKKTTRRAPRTAITGPPSPLADEQMVGRALLGESGGIGNG